MVITLFLILKTGTQNWTPYQLDQLSDVDFPAINWKFVNDRLSQLREKSFMWLKQNIV